MFTEHVKNENMKKVKNEGALNKLTSQTVFFYYFLRDKMQIDTKFIFYCLFLNLCSFNNLCSFIFKSFNFYILSLF